MARCRPAHCPVISRHHRHLHAADACRRTAADAEILQAPRKGNATLLPRVPGCLLRRSEGGLQEFQSRIPVVPQAEGLQDRSGNKEDPAADLRAERDLRQCRPGRERAGSARKNIVVIFAEGFSAEWIDLFNRYRGLTPNIDSFLGESLYFDGYFNHTAATFRGLRGQLTSSYQTEGGYYRTNDGLGQISGEKLRKKLAGNLVSVPQILEKNGFHTYFLSAHERKEQLNLMLETLEFGRVFGADDFYEGSAPDRPAALLCTEGACFRRQAAAAVFSRPVQHRNSPRAELAG